MTDQNKKAMLLVQCLPWNIFGDKCSTATAIRGLVEQRGELSTRRRPGSGGQGDGGLVVAEGEQAEGCRDGQRNQSADTKTAASRNEATESRNEAAEFLPGWIVAWSRGSSGARESWLQGLSFPPGVFGNKVVLG
jgi:hypothetical protein